jgi:hypothetical protein
MALMMLGGGKPEAGSRQTRIGLLPPAPGLQTWRFS